VAFPKNGAYGMKTNKSILGATAVVTAVLAFASGAHAATKVDIGTTNNGGYFFLTGGTSTSSVITSTFGASIAGKNTPFDYDFNFIIDNNGTGSGSLSYAYNGSVQDLVISDVLIDNQSYKADITGTETTGYKLTVNDIAIKSGIENTIEVIGKTGAANTLAGFSGTANFNMAAVPEPASWALMIGGLGLVGVALRRRNALTLVA
jgi:hypothetical protein